MSKAKRKDPYLSGLLQKLAETDKKISFTRLRSEDLDGESREAIYEFIEKYSGRFGVRCRQVCTIITCTVKEMGARHRKIRF